MGVALLSLQSTSREHPGWLAWGYCTHARHGENLQPRVLSENREVIKPHRSYDGRMGHRWFLCMCAISRDFNRLPAATRKGRSTRPETRDSWRGDGRLFSCNCRAITGNRGVCGPAWEANLASYFTHRDGRMWFKIAVLPMNRRLDAIPGWRREVGHSNMLQGADADVADYPIV